jgi:hypothetical protein
MTGAELFSEFVDFIRSFPQVFPPVRGHSWTPTITAFLYKLGISRGFEVRCGDYSRKLDKIRTSRRLPSLPGGYDDLCRPWVTNNLQAHGILAIDVCWVPLGFSIPRNFSSVPVPHKAEIILAYEHEDEGLLYTDKRGTNLNVVIDEVRKIGNVKAQRKVLSYITSRSEIADQKHIEAISAEIKLIPECSAMAEEWFVLQIAKYEKPNSNKATIWNNGRRMLHCKGTSLNGSGDTIGSSIEAIVEYPS